jgi:NO-binding membrane sensor protein with MHYT domain
MTATYNFYLVGLSAFIAILTSYTTLELVGWLALSRGVERQTWLVIGAIVMGIGIWSMHFIAMLAFSLPILINYNFLIVLASLVAAILGAGQALFIISLPIVNIVTLLAGSISMGIAIAGMHYIGMAAMEMTADIQYNPQLFALSVAIAIGVSLVAIKLSFEFREKTDSSSKFWKVISAIVMGVAVLSMHYTGMAAALFKTNSNKVVEVSDLGNYSLGLLIGVLTVIALGITLFIGFANSLPEKQ